MAPHDDPGSRPCPRGARRVSALALAHSGLFCIALAWCFGGNSLSLRTPLLLFASLGLPLPLLLLAPGLRPSRGSARLLWLLLPLLALDLVCAASLLTPSFRPISAWGQTTLLPLQVPIWLPSCARPQETAAALWLTNCLYVCGFNVLAFARRRGQLRLLLGALVVNACLLAVLGSLQKLAQSPGLYFGSVPSSNPRFFATFIYNNHWGAFAVLWLCAALGLLWRLLGRPDPRHRDFWHSPGAFFLAAALIVGLTPPLSGSRSGTLLVLLVGALATFATMRHLRRHSSRGAPAPVRGGRNTGRSLLHLCLPPLLALGVLGFALWLAAPALRPRLRDTTEQLSAMRREGSLGSRVDLYRDTFALFTSRPVFGWGKGAYGTAFYNVNSQRPNRDGLPVVYRDAHSDWLQCLAELGLVGSLLTALLALAPLARFRRARLLDTPLSRWLLIGCSLLLLYALVEFPFGNPAVTLSWWLCFFAALRYPQSD